MAKKEVVLIGAGKIGRGYMGDVFNRAGYHLTFLEYDENLVHKMREQGYYTVFMTDRQETGSGEVSSFRIEGYDAFCTETEREACVNAIANTNYATIHVYPGACESIGHMVGDAIKQRKEADNEEPLDIFMCVNFQGPAETIRGYALEQLETEEEKAFLDEHIGFIETMIFRNGGTPTEEMLEMDPICVAMSDNTNWPVDQDAFKGIPPQGVEMALTDNFSARLVYKVWAGNMMHCCNAFYGKPKGYEYYYESALDPYIYKCAALGKLEANHGICEEYNTPVEVLDTNHKGKIAPFAPEKVNTADRDTLNRIGADPIRKLRRNDRFVGPAILSMKHGKIPYFLTRGAAMGFYFENPEDAAAVELQNFIKENGIEKAIEKYCGLNLNDKDENFVYQLILAHYYEIGDVDPFTVSYISQ